MGRLGHTLSTLRPVGRPTRTQDALPGVGQTLPGGLSVPLGSSERFLRCFLHRFPPFPGLPWRKRASVRHTSVRIATSLTCSGHIDRGIPGHLQCRHVCDSFHVAGLMCSSTRERLLTVYGSNSPGENDGCRSAGEPTPPLRAWPGEFPRLAEDAASCPPRRPALHARRTPLELPLGPRHSGWDVRGFGWRPCASTPGSGRRTATAGPTCRSASTSRTSSQLPPTDFLRP